MPDRDMNALAAATAEGSALANAMDEGTVLAITASYLAGKEAGKREAQAETKPG